MDFNTSLSHSAQCLKQAIPLLVKYKIPVTPINYAIWYCYVLGGNLALNIELDNILAEHGTCPASSARYLFDKYLSDKDLALFHQISDNFQGTLESVQIDIDSTLASSQSFNSVLLQCKSDLSALDKNDISSFDNVLSYVDKLTEESVVMQQTAFSFQKKLQAAYSEITELKQALVSTQEAAVTDQLTGLLNRGKFDDDIVVHINQFISSNPISKTLIFLDIDHFKQFNDDFGHQKGDDVLKVVANKLSRHCLNKANAYRYGGEEFCILADFKSVSEALNFCQAIRQDIEKLSVKGKKTGKAIRNITASFGIAFYKQKQSLEDFIASADKALYLAKAHGRNRVEIAPAI
ncbi:GGDEF domain-containing protein [Pseudoalteromonas sp. BZB3]|uniref:GGDEF domain-containing protein n=1 Tax=Pseudoalteromonas sp. BZB3 TaxID=3136670 RepID=UPI0032C40CE7|tara:strand:+ start:228 stop:1274 length:1047 start_codon:yes stop_codon:yes gene_type:complete